MNNIIKLLQHHRSIRKFEEKSIPEEILKEVIRSAQCASTSGHAQAYTIIGVKSKETKKKLSVLSGNQPYIESCPVFLVFCADLQRLNQVFNMDREQTAGDFLELFIMSTVDAALAAQNAMIAAESFGLGGVYIGGIRNNPQEISDLLALPDLVYPVFGMCLGYPAQAPAIKPRLPLEMICKEEVYDDSQDANLLKGYDSIVKDYYTKRTQGKISSTWSEQVSEKVKNDTRPHMREFLLKRGFKLK